VARVGDAPVPIALAVEEDQVAGGPAIKVVEMGVPVAEEGGRAAKDRRVGEAV
jgi:hypothetical protein